MGDDIRSSTGAKALATPFVLPTLSEAIDEARLSVDRSCLLAGIEALTEMMAEDATAVCGARHRRHEARRGWRWGTATSEIGICGNEVARPSWEALREWAMSLMVLKDSTRKYGRACPACAATGRRSRRFPGASWR